MKNPVYSFYEEENGQVKVERLRDHVEHALGVFNENSRLVKYGRNLMGSFYDLLRYAIILHDFGKAPFNLVRPQEGQYKETKKLSFRGHEVISAWFADKYLDVLVKRGEMEESEAQLIVLAVLLHHHPMNEKKRAEHLSSRNDICVDREVVEAFYNELMGIVEELPVEVASDGRTCAPDIVRDIYTDGAVLGLFNSYWVDLWMNATPNVRKAFLLLVQGLVAADYRSASSRGGRPTVFGNAVELFLSNWT